MLNTPAAVLVAKSPPAQRCRSTRRFALARYNPDGSLDVSFDSDGLVTLGFGTRSMDTIYAVAVQPDARIVVAGSASMAYELNGVTFGQKRFCPRAAQPRRLTRHELWARRHREHGFRRGPDIAYALVLQPDGRLVAVGYTSQNASIDFALVRYTSNGLPDRSFGMGGKVATALSPAGKGDDSARAVALQADGRIIVAGRTAWASPPLSP